MILSILIIAVASLVDGMVEGFEFDGRRFFEIKFRAKKYGFWGSLSSEKKKNLYDKLFGVFDFYHVADDIRKYGYLTGAFVLAITAGINWIYIIAALLVSIFGKQIGMKIIRINKSKTQK